MGMSIAQKILAKRRAVAKAALPTVADRMAPQPLSAAQKRLWFLEKLDNAGVAYNVPLLYQLNGQLNFNALCRTVDTLVARHEILHTRFVEVGSEPMAQLDPGTKVKINHVVVADKSQAMAQIGHSIQQRFDLARGPLIRIELYQYSLEQSLLCINQHHIICDGWSITRLLAELSSCYKSDVEGNVAHLPPMALQYMDYTQWAAEQAHAKGLDYWIQRLEESHYLNLGEEGPAEASAGYLPLKFASDIRVGLDKLCNDNHATLFMALLGFYQLFLSRYSGQDDISVGVPVANRTDKAHEGIMGFFVNTLVMRQQFDREMDLNSLLSNTRRIVSSGFDHQSVPFEQVVERLCPVRQPGMTPLFRTMFVLQTSSDVNALQLPGIKSEFQSICQDTAKFDLTLNLRETQDGIEGGFEYRQGIFSADRVAQMAACFEQLIANCLAEPQADVTTIEWLPKNVRQQLLNMSRTDGVTIDGDILDEFSRQVSEYGNKVALVCGDQALTYRELDERANQWARYLREQGVEPCERVGLAFHRNRMESIPCLLAILKLGAVYVPLDLTSPAARLAYIVKHTGIRHLLTSEASLEVAAQLHLDVCVDSYSNSEIERSVQPEPLCYVMYTSGTTGTPKGVMISQRGVLRLVKDVNYVKLTADDVFLQSAPLAFDAATFEIWGSLLNGATLVLLSEPNFSLQHVGRLLGKHNVSVLWLTAQLFHTMVDIDVTAFAQLRVLLAGGDVLSAARIKQLKEAYPHLEVVNGYGPTETTTFAACHRFSRDDVARGRVPIGRPIDNTAIYILDKKQQLRPQLCEGEMFIAGAGVGLGYWNAPEQSAAVFLPDQYSGEADARMYRSGDIARYEMDGSITFLGRRDGQVKLRGYRIELAEIRRELEYVSGISQAEIIVRSEGDEKQLVAYYNADGGAIDPQILRSELTRSLPEYMLPHYFVHLVQFPETRNGKVDRRQLPAPRASDAMVQADVAILEGEVEQRIAAIWQELLLVEQVGRDHNFFSLGGHSLLTAQLQARLQKEFQVQLSIEDIFRNATVATQAIFVMSSKPVSAISITKTEQRDGYQSLSPAQERLWFLYQVNPEGTEYNVPIVYRLQGELDITALQKGINALVERHEVLRTLFVEHDGKPWQKILPSLHVPVTEKTFADEVQATTNMADELAAGFDLACGPLIRVVLFHAPENVHFLLINQHHIICDGWSITRLLRELGDLYQGNPLPALELQYLDYTLWVEGRDHSEGLDYWEQALKGAEPLFLVEEGSAQQGGGYYPISLDSTLTAGLNRLCQQSGSTLFMALLGLYQVLLARLSGQSDISVGVPVANRQLEALESVFGFFVNTLVMRVQLPKAINSHGLLAQTRESVLAGFAHQDVPFEQVVERLCPERIEGHTPLFRTMLVLQLSSEANALQLPGVQTDWVKLPHSTAKFDLTLNLRETDQGIEGGFEYRKGMFSQARIAQLAVAFETMLGLAVKSPQADLIQVDYLTGNARNHWLVQCQNGGARIECSLLQVFAEQVSEKADKIALACGEQQLTYAQLDAKANQWAWYLQLQGVSGGDRVGLAFQRNQLESIVCTLAVLKLGAVYVPLDLQQPKQRLEYIVEHTGIEHLITSDAAIPLNTVLHHPSAADGCPETAFAPGNQASGLCYIMFTSGTTGKPKGVMVEEKGILRLVRNTRYIELKESDIFLQTAPQPFDVATFEIWGSLLNGATLVLPSQAGFSLAHIVQLLHQHKINVLWLTAQLFHAMIDVNAEALNGLRMVLAGGDVLSAERIKQLHRSCPGLAIVNGYGPTEATTFSSSHLFSANDIAQSRVSIGRPIDHTSIYILDNNHLPVPALTEGEIYIGGAGVARGYWNAPELTAAAFMADPFTSKPGARMYRSGDIARYELDGTITFLGRRDGQVKIRGFRIELGEVKRILENVAGVLQADLVIRSEGDDKQLLAYYASDCGAIAPLQLREQLLAILPDYMIPGYFVHLDSFPMTANGKVDRQQLPPPTASDAAGLADDKKPQTELEKSISAIWQSLLKVGNIGLNHNFFDLGGHSLLTARLQVRLLSEFGIKLTIGEIFANPTVADQAKLIAATAPQSGLDIVAVSDRDAAWPLSNAQCRLWLLAKMDERSVDYNVPVVYRVRGDINVAALQQSLDKLVARHEILRTRFFEVEGEPRQQVSKHCTIKVKVLEGEINSLLTQSLATPFDLAKDPLLRVELFGNGVEWVLCVNQHHIICDGWSVIQLINELGALYNEDASGEVAVLAPLSVQYLDYAQWDNARDHSAGLAYWQNSLEGAERLSLPVEGEARVGGGYYCFTIGRRIKKALDNACQQNGCTPFMALLGFYQVLLSRYSGQRDISVGVPVANREVETLESVMGFFVNTLVMRQQLGRQLSVAKLLKNTKSLVLAGFEHQSVPFEMVVDKISPVREKGQTPLFNTMFALESRSEARVLELNGVQCERFAPGLNTAKFDLTLTLRETEEGLEGGFEYRHGLFSQARIAQITEYFISLVDNSLANLDRDIVSLDYLPASLKQHYIDNDNDNDNDYEPVTDTINSRFAAQVKASPDKLALACGERAYSYVELDAIANRWANRLIAHGVKIGDRVAVALKTDERFVVSVLAALKCGAVYVPLDITAPQARLEQIINDAQPKVTILEPGFELAGTNGIYWQDIPGENSRAPVVEASAICPAYLIYTSGSTGMPKGVINTHGGVVNLVDANRIFTENDIMGQVNNVSFDAAVWELWVALLKGGTLVCVSKTQLLDPEELSKLVAYHGINVALFTTALFNLFASEHPALLSRFKAVYFGGEASDLQVVKRLDEQHRPEFLVNAYGPSENAVITTEFLTNDLPSTARQVSIGTAINGCQAYVLDQNFNQVPPGVVGELCIAGAGLATGYMNMPGMTAQRYVPNRFDSQGGRLYLSGDLAFFDNDRNIQYAGRADRQVKIRGHRVEMSDIASVISNLVESANVHVEYFKEQGTLIAYIVGSNSKIDNSKIDTGAMRRQLSGMLASYMLPDHIVSIDALPLTNNGKIDTTKLPIPEYSTVDRVMPRSSDEKMVWDCFNAVLDTCNFGIDDSFFDIGGNSLLAVKLASELQARADIRLPLNLLFECATVSAISRYLHHDGGIVLDKPLILIKQGSSEKTVFAIHPVEGESFCYVELAQQFASDYTVLGIDHPVCHGIEAAQSIEGLAELYAGLICKMQQKGPYYLLGWSMGGLIGLEVAKRLGEQSHLVMLDTFNPRALVDIKSVVRPGEGSEVEQANKKAFMQYQPGKVDMPTLLIRPQQSLESLLDNDDGANGMAAILGGSNETVLCGHDHKDMVRGQYTDSIAQQIQQFWQNDTKGAITMNSEQEYRQRMIESFRWRYECNQDSWSADPGLRATAEKLSGLLQGRGKHILDIGIGVGNPTLVLLEAGQKVTGIDIFAHKGWDELRATWQQNIELIKGDFNTWECGAGQFDAVIDNGCMHHQHPSIYLDYLAKVQQVLKAGGYLVLNIYADMDGAAESGKIEYTDHERICKYFTESEINALLCHAGFDVVSHEYLLRHGLGEYYLLVVARKPAVE